MYLGYPPPLSRTALPFLYSYLRRAPTVRQRASTYNESRTWQPIPMSYLPTVISRYVVRKFI